MIETVTTSPPAKLNLFLEIPSKRQDGYHEIDTVMVAIDWRDELKVQTTDSDAIELDVDWLPSRTQVAQLLKLDGDRERKLLDLPSGSNNLVARALNAFRDRFQIRSGYRVTLRKRIPAGAGLGGASSDAAHAIACAAYLHQIDRHDTRLMEVGASIGSDVPFFMLPSDETDRNVESIRARGRGELLERLRKRTPLHFVVAFPNQSLSTALVYQRLRVPSDPLTADGFLNTFLGRHDGVLADVMMNRLQEPAIEIVPGLNDLLESLRQANLHACQLSGSGSACFGIARDAEHAKQAVARLKVELQPGVLLQAVQMVSPASSIVIEPS